MGKVIECLTEKEEEFIKSQKVFFVATSPLDKDHHVNVSPKAPGTSVVVLDPYTVAYCDLSGSGAETTAHVLENSRMTLLFCNIEHGPPKILRLYGKAKVLAKDCISDSKEFNKLVPKFPKSITSDYGFRAIFILNIDRMSTSCGYSLPVMKFEKYRQILNEYSTKKGEQGMVDYRIYKNSFSIDGLLSYGIYSHGNSKNIIPKPEDGYIFGEVDEDGGKKKSSEGNKAYIIPKQQTRNNGSSSTIMSFMVGVAVGVSVMFVMMNKK